MNSRSFLLALAVSALPGALHSVPEQFITRNTDRLEQLFRELDPQHPAMAPILSRWQAGDKAAAADALVAYYEGKPFPLELLDAPGLPADLQAEADAALDNSFRLNDRWQAIAIRPDGGLDWTDRGSGGDKENAWMLNRHMFLPLLARAWEESGDERYRERLNFLWRDWILNSPYPARLTFSAQWRPLEVARRVMNSWIHVFYGGNVMDPETRLLVLASVIDHGDALRHHASFWGGNHLISEKIALLSLAAAWPEFRHAAAWREYAIERVSAEFMRQTYPDGSYKELSNHYQRVVLVNAMTFLQLLAVNGEDFRERPVYRRIEEMWNFFAGATCPDGTGPVNNASDEEDNAAHLRNAWEFFDRPDWLGIATHGAEGMLPNGPPSRLFPWAGQAYIRNNWGPRADWIYFDAGPYGSAHQHVDRLHVSAWLDGRPILKDSGRYTYLPGIWKNYFQGPEGHSILLLDGRPCEQGPFKVEAPMPLAFEETGAAVFAAAQARFKPTGIGDALPSLTGAVPWTRAILYDKRGFALILDHLVAFSRHAVEARWHFHPGVETGEAETLLRLLSPSDVLSRHIRTGQESQPLGGFYSPEYNTRLPAPLASFTGSIDRPSTFIWIIDADTQAPVRAAVLSKPGAPVLELTLERESKPVASARIRLHPEPELLEYTPF